MHCLRGIKLQRNKKYLGAREMAQRLRTLIGLLGDPGSMSGSHMVAHCLFLPEALHSHVIKTYTQLRPSYLENKR